MNSAASSEKTDETKIFGVGFCFMFQLANVMVKKNLNADQRIFPPNMKYGRKLIMNVVATSIASEFQVDAPKKSRWLQIFLKQESLHKNISFPTLFFAEFSVKTPLEKVHFYSKQTSKSSTDVYFAPMSLILTRIVTNMALFPVKFGCWLKKFSAFLCCLSRNYSVKYFRTPKSWDMIFWSLAVQSFKELKRSNQNALRVNFSELKSTECMQPGEKILNWQNPLAKKRKLRGSLNIYLFIL